MYRPNISCIIFRERFPGEREYLIVRKPRTNHAWQFPQGGIEPNEDVKNAASRELKEELGTEKFEYLKKSSHVYFYKFPNSEKKDNYIGQKQVYYWIKFNGKDEDIKLNRNELAEYSWVAEDKLAGYFESDEYIQKIYDVIDECGDIE
jgi:putative (di)nucleoside polyphosphate hydrolase